MIRLATIEDLPRMSAWAEEFYASSRHLNGFQLERFVQIWTELLRLEAGVIFLATESNAQEEVIVGAIGGMVHRDLYNGELTASEAFWRVREGSRGSGVALYRVFEQWAQEQGCLSIQMVHLTGVMSEKVGKFYLRMGYESIETRYSKRLEQKAEKAA